MKADGYYDGAELLLGPGAAHFVSDEGNGQKRPLGFAPPKPRIEVPSPRRTRRPRRVARLVNRGTSRNL